MVQAFKALAPEIVAPVSRAVAGARRPLLPPAGPPAWASAPSISIDYAIMEKATELWVMPYAGGWSDLGGWAAIWNESPRDGNGVATARATLQQ